MPHPDTQDPNPPSAEQQKMLDKLMELPTHRPETTVAQAAVETAVAPVLQLAPHQQRVVVERDQLHQRLTLLINFIEGPHFNRASSAEQNLLNIQARQMRDLLDTLNLRIKLWSNT